MKIKLAVLLVFLAAIGGSSLAQAPNNARMLSTPNAQTGTTYTFVAADTARVVTFNNAGPVSVNLPSGANFGFGSGTVISAINTGTGTVTITCASCTITSGSSAPSATLILTAGQGADLYGGVGTPAVNYVAFTLNSPTGVNPYVDVSRFGAYFGPQNPPSTTGAITSGTPNLVAASAIDLANGQGVLVLGAGPASSLSTPTGVVAAPWGVTGSTTYNYCTVAEDYLGGRTACSAAGASTTSAATLGIQSATLSSCNRVAGIVTCTTTGNHNFTAGAQVNIVKNSTGDATQRFEGVFSIFTTPTATTFTYTQYGALDVSGTVTTGTAQVNATNLVRWQSDATNTVLRSHVYRCTASCGAIGPNYAYAGTVVGVDGYFQDYGLAVAVGNVGNGDVPATAPTTATNTALSSTILSGGGTTSLTLANNAGATVAGATVLHDNTPNLVAACSSFTKGGIVYIPTSNVATNYFPINSTFKLSSCPRGTQLQVNSKVFANASIIMSVNQNIQGLPGGRDTSVASPAFYDIRPQALFIGFAYPYIYIPPTSNNISLDDLLFNCNQAYQPCIYQDESTTGGGIAGARFRNVHVTGTNGNNTVWVVKNGFGLFWEYGGWSNAGASFASPPGMLFSPNCGLGNTNQQQVYLITTQNTYAFGGTVFDNCNQSVNTGLNNIVFRDMIQESPSGPMFRFANTGGVGTFNGRIAWWELTRVNYADPITPGLMTPVVDATMVNQITGLRFISPGAPQVLLETNSGSVNGVDVSADFPNLVGAQNYTISAAGTFFNYPAKASGALGHFAYQMAVPSPPQSAIVSAGGSVPVGAHTYTIAAVDYSGNETTLSTGVTATTTGGNQTVTVTLPAAFPAGAKGVNVYRDGARAQFGGCPVPQFTTPGGTYVDTFAFLCGQSQTTVNNAGATLLDANGLATTQLRLSGPNNIAGTPDFGGVTGGFFQINGAALAAQNIFNLMPDASTTGITCENTLGGGQVRCHVTSTAGGGVSIIACTFSSPAQKQIIAFDGSSICKNANPAVLTTDKATVNTTSYPPVALDLGNDILRKAAVAMNDTWPQGGSVGFPIGWYGLLCNTDTVNSDTATPTTSTVNGQANVVITPNTCGHMIVDPANNWRFHGFNWVKCGTNLTTVYNADGSTTCNASAGGTPRWDQIIAATATNTTANGNFPQTLNFAQTTDSQAAWAFGDTSAATGGTVTGSLANQSLLKVSTASGSTETPFSVSQGAVTGTTAIPGAQFQCTWNNGSLIGRCLGISVVQTANAGASWPFFINTGVAGTTNVLNVDTAGNMVLAGNLNTPLINFPAGNTGIRTVASNVPLLIVGGIDTSNAGGTQTTLTLRGSNNTSATGTAASNVVVQGGECASVTSANTCANTVKIIDPYFSTGTATANDLACVTAANTVASCSATGSGQFIGVIDSSVTNSARILSLSSGGTHTFNATSATFTNGHFVCQSTVAASGNLVVDSATVCAAGLGVGIYMGTTGTTATPSVWMRPY